MLGEDVKSCKTPASNWNIDEFILTKDILKRVLSWAFLMVWFNLAG